LIVVEFLLILNISVGLVAFNIFLLLARLVQRYYIFIIVNYIWCS